jgi:hypothetical protein
MDALETASPPKALSNAGTVPDLSPKARIHWPRIFAEGVAIVVSILLAFALNEWWEGVQSADEEAATLLGLQSDFLATAADLRRVQEEVAIGRRATDSILLLSGPRATVNPDEATRLVAEVVSGYPAFVPIEGTLRALLTSEGLERVSNDALRSKLATWPQSTARIEANRLRTNEFMDDDLMPYLRSRLPVRSLDALSSPELGSTRRSNHALNAVPLYQQLEFENLVNELYFLQSGMLFYLDNALAEAEAILALIEQEVGDR